jgi:fermentation-respiration switch protein FrsA (DUF1100 family)
MKTVTFRNSDMYWHIAADIHFPPNFDETKKYPAIISAHPIGSCKEQTSGNVYGKALAEEGFIAEARGENVKVDDLLPSSPEEAKKLGITDRDPLEATEYYRTPRGRRPNGLNRSVPSHQGAAVGWDAFHLAEVLLTQPICIVVGDKPGAFGAYRDGCEIVERAASKEKELVVAQGWSHYDLYETKYRCRDS